VANVGAPHDRFHFVVQEGRLDEILERDCNRSAYLRQSFDDGRRRQYNAWNALCGRDYRDEASLKCGDARGVLQWGLARRVFVSRGECNYEIREIYCLLRTDWQSMEPQCAEELAKEPMPDCIRCEARKDGHHRRRLGFEETP